LLFYGDEAIMITLRVFGKIMMVSYPVKIDSAKLLCYLHAQVICIVNKSVTFVNKS